MSRILICIVSLFWIVIGGVPNVAQDRKFPFEQARWSPDDKLIALNFVRTISIVDAELNPITVLTLPRYPTATSYNNADDIMWHQDGQLLAATTVSDNYDGLLVVWDTSTWKIIHKVEGVRGRLTWSSDSNFLSGQGKVVDLSTNSVIYQTYSQNNPITSATWSPTNINEMAFARTGFGDIIIINPFNGTIQKILPHDSAFFPVFSPQGDNIVLMSNLGYREPHVLNILETNAYTLVNSYPLESFVNSETDAIFWIGGNRLAITMQNGKIMELNLLTGVLKEIYTMERNMEAYWNHAGDKFIIRDLYNTIVDYPSQSN